MIHADRRRHGGFTLIELLIVIALVGIMTSMAAALYVGWRADARNREVVAQLERSLADARQDAKRLSTDVTVTITDDATQYAIAANPVSLPSGVTTSTATVSGETITFSGVLGVQQPFQRVEFDVISGGGLFARTATVAVIPPLGKVAAVR